MQIKKNFKLIHTLALHKLQLEYSDQMFGYVWAVINPLVYILSFWFFAYVGLKGGYVDGIPFIIWLVPGVLSYRFSVTVIGKGPKMLTANAMLIKDVDINPKFIPLIEVLKEIYTHVVVMGVMFFIFLVIVFSMTGSFEYMPSLHYLNFIYYWFTATVFLTALSYILSAFGVLFRDTKNIVSAILVPLFWATPVLFPVEHGINPLLEKIEMIFNPIYFFINGYRETMIYKVYFFENITYDIYIWIIIIILLLFARKLWKFITPILADLV